MASLNLKQGTMINEVHVPSSKSYANRALILAAIKKSSVTLQNLPESTDVTILLACLKELGLVIKPSGKDVAIEDSFPACETSDKRLEVGEGGTTARFLAALLLNGHKKYELILGERLKERPWKEFIEQARSLGAKAELNDAVLTLQGPISAPKILEVDCTRTTQFATALELSLSDFGTKVVPVNLTTSQSYWAMTEKVIQDLKRTDVYPVPLDWSSASYPLAFAALNHEITFPGLFDDSFQADSKFLKILRKLGAVTEHEKGMTIKPVSRHEAISFDVTDALDLVPTLGYFLSHIKGVHELHGTKNLTFKESDRLAEIMNLIKTFGRKTWLEGETLFIEGSDLEINEQKHLTLPNDHRMVMVGALFLRQHSGGSVTPPEAVTKSYPEFFELFNS
ncbi:3-phosphoshikimate 1-carboxyvinyltransferase [Peredibacter sp. HCB2-198]|uniref:3-phosphoshikimate 1-carboxyvinyltransferase n=1 Tax=Peredibacter sp. HCB2-198 TaxID=3383025 RepID=UPI0038B601EE